MRARLLHPDRGPICTCEGRVASAALGFLVLAWLLRVALGDLPSPIAILILVAPGFVLIPFLPHQLRMPPIGWLLAPPLGFAATSTVLITIAAVGIPLTSTAIFLSLTAICAVGLFASVAVGQEPDLGGGLWARAKAAPEVPALLLAVGFLAIGLQYRVIGGSPLPGEDWGHYLLYATQIANHHHLLLDNPYWMFGRTPFAEDPGVPSLYSAYLILTGKGPDLLYRGIWVFAVLGIVTTYVFVRTLFGDIAGVVAAAVYAVVPMNQDILAWHGLANVYALMFIPLILLVAGMALRGEDSWRWCGLLALLLVAVAAGHRLSFVIVVLALLLVVPLGVTLSARRIGSFAVRTAILAAVFGFGVTIHLVRQADSIGGVQDYRAYLPGKITGQVLQVVARDLTWPVIILASLAVAAVLARKRFRSDPATYVPLAFAGALVVVGYSWVLHFPTEYYRVIYYLPISLAAVIGIAWTSIPRRASLPVAVLLIAAVAYISGSRVREVRDFYTFVDRGSSSGLTYLTQRLTPNERVAADLCWSFIAPWSLKHQVLAGLPAQYSLAVADARPSAIARRILRGTERSRQLGARYGVRYVLLDPLCAAQANQLPPVPSHGTPIYESTHLVILRL